MRSNCIAPVARTRLTAADARARRQRAARPRIRRSSTLWDPANVSPFVAYLATADCPFTGGVFHVMGNEVALFEGWSLLDRIKNDEGRWTVAGLQAEAKKLLDGRPALASQGSDMAALVGNMMG